jgi:predicted RNA binding protein YcfA (HicA-like mRNA interferase family)
LARDDKLLALRRARSISLADVERACRAAGLDCSAPRGGGSHFKISHPASPKILTVPFKRPIKPVYIRALVDLIDEVSVK